MQIDLRLRQSTSFSRPGWGQLIHSHKGAQWARIVYLVNNNLSLGQVKIICYKVLNVVWIIRSISRLSMEATSEIQRTTPNSIKTLSTPITTASTTKAIPITLTIHSWSQSAAMYCPILTLSNTIRLLIIEWISRPTRVKTNDQYWLTTQLEVMEKRHCRSVRIMCPLWKRKLGLLIRRLLIQTSWWREREKKATTQHPTYRLLTQPMSVYSHHSWWYKNYRKMWYSSNWAWRWITNVTTTCCSLITS